MKDNFDLAYTAGYFDGDGSFYCRKELDKRSGKAHFRCGIQVSSTNDQVLKDFKDRFGGSVSSGLIYEGRSHHKPLFSYHLQNQKALVLSKLLLPFLIEKKHQAEILCQFFESKNSDFKISCINKITKCKILSKDVNKSTKELIIKTKNTIEPTNEDFSYLAGFIDAECCLKIMRTRGSKKLSQKIYLCCNNTSSTVFKWIIPRFAGNLYFVSRKNKTPNYNDQLYWYISSKALDRLLPNIYPFLRFKKPVCKQLMNFSETIFSNSGDRQSKQFKTALAFALLKREFIIQKVHLLNRKGC